MAHAKSSDPATPQKKKNLERALIVKQMHADLTYFVEFVPTPSTVLEAWSSYSRYNCRTSLQRCGDQAISAQLKSMFANMCLKILKTYIEARLKDEAATEHIKARSVVVGLLVWDLY